MANEPEKKLEELIHRELRQLPDLQAPPGIIQRVRATLEARARLPWYQRSWFTWPLPLRLASAAMMLALVSGLTWLISHVSVRPTGLEFPLVESPTVSTLMSVTSAIANALVLTARAINPIYLAAALALVAMMYISCIALGTVCYRIAWDKR
jgi:hypothetical protein